ncbi:MAG: prepilin peptidase [Lachnospiraceae bacterium]|nr:prepilin peptidase [Lachnospiraceae bacterium]
MMKDIICMAVLAAAAAEDLSKKQVSGSLLVMLAAAGVFDSILSGSFSPEIFLSLFPGAMLLLLSHISGNRIGPGDAMCFMALGFGMKPEKLIAAMCMSFFMAGIFAGSVLIRKGRREADESYAFIPFILFAFAADKLLETF